MATPATHAAPAGHDRPKSPARKRRAPRPTPRVWAALLVPAAVALATSGVVFGACSYPDATFIGDTASGVGGQGGTGPGQGGELVTVSTGPCTDADQDGVCVEAGDCNDNDPNVRPGQTAFFTEPRPDDGSFDYNCNGADDKEFPLTCSPTSPCPAPAGFASDVGCGQSGNFGSCSSAPVAPGCLVQNLTTRIQACH